MWHFQWNLSHEENCGKTGKVELREGKAVGERKRGRGKDRTGEDGELRRAV